MQYKIKVKLDDLENTDSLCIHHVNKEVVAPIEIYNLSCLFHKILLVHQRREIKKQFEVAVSGVTHKLKTEDVLNIL